MEPIEIEIVERMDGRFDVVFDAEIIHSDVSLHFAYKQAASLTEPGYVTLLIGGRTRVAL